MIKQNITFHVTTICDRCGAEQEGEQVSATLDIYYLTRAKAESAEGYKVVRLPDQNLLLCPRCLSIVTDVMRPVK